MTKEETTTQDENEPKSIPRMSDDDIREFTDALLSGQVFTSSQAPENMLSSVFMPLVMGAAEHLEPIIDDVGCLYEYMDKALPMGVNGLPIFPSFRIMHKEDWEIVVETYNYEKVRRDTMPVIRKAKDTGDE